MTFQTPPSHFSLSNQHTPAARRNNRMTWRLLSLASVLLVIVVWLGLAAAALLTYQDLHRSAQQRLAAELSFLQRLPPAVQMPTGNTGARVFRLRTPLPERLQQRLLDKTATISASTARQLGWQAYGVQGEVLAMQVSNTQPALMIAVPMAKKRLQRTFITTGVLLSLAIFGVMGLLGVVLHARIRRRIAYIDEAANVIMQGDLQKRIPINPALQDEYSRLAETLNAMLDKIAHLMQGLRNVNNNIAHDLKSPLNRMRSRMEVALMNSRSADEYQQALAQSIEDVDALLQTFQSLLLMGNLESNARNYQLQPVSLSNIMQSLGELYAAIAEEKSHAFTLQIDEGVEVFANAGLLSQALSNLLDNAIKYTPEGGQITMSLTQTPAMAMVVITDNGIGIPAHERQAVFERFTRLDSARQLPGTGLGMSLVRAILAVHHASIQLHDNQPGLRVEIRLRTSQSAK